MVGSEEELAHDDGRIVTLDSRVPGAEKLARFVERVVISRHLTSLMQEYHRGQVLKFGPLCVSQQGLQLAQQQALLHWSEIKYIDCIQDVLILQQKEHLEDWATVALSSLPNVCILEAMIRHLHRLHKAMAASGQACLPVQAQHQDGAGSIDTIQKQDDVKRIW